MHKLHAAEIWFNFNQSHVTILIFIKGFTNQNIIIKLHLKSVIAERFFDIELHMSSFLEIN